MSAPEAPLIERSRFEKAYEPNTDAPGPWDIPSPQPAFVRVADDITGRVLDSGCGSGENALYFAELGRDVTGIDFAEGAIRIAQEKASARGLKARFLVKDALTLKEWNERFDNIIDSAVFHVFSDEDIQPYVQGLAHVLKPGGRLFLICFSDAEPGEQGPRRIPKQKLYDSFTEGWVVESVEESRYQILPQFDGSMFSAGGPKAWFAVMRRAV
jgi:SAM-dependent methyltransferase